jgi:UDP-N-acetylmuramoyl-tripeptide--D-alanyl-D-alanine ligase
MAQTATWKQPFHWARRSIAKYWLKLFPKITVIGIVGSYGKTNTTKAITQVLSEKYRTLQTDFNLDTIYNLPITILKVRPWHQKLVLELGVDHRGEMDSYMKLVRPSIGVLTGITPVHSDPELLGSVEGIIKEEGKLLQALPKEGVAILNRDDENVRQMAQKTKAKVIWYGFKDRKNCHFWAEKIKVDLKGTSFNLHSNYLNNWRKGLSIKTGLIGRHFTHACLAAAVVGKLQGLTLKEIEKGLTKLTPLKGRVSIEKGPKGSILINDALRASPASTIAGLQVLKDLPTKGRRIAVLGEMGELGESAEIEHQRIGQAVAKLGKVDFLISVGPLQKLTASEAIRNGMKKSQVFWAKDVLQAAQILKKILKKGDLFYLKGSLLRHMERIVLALEGKDVGCKAISCHFYPQCPSCPYLVTGI